jgi:hypothetical protein
MSEYDKTTKRCSTEPTLRAQLRAVARHTTQLSAVLYFGLAAEPPWPPPPPDPPPEPIDAPPPIVAEAFPLWLAVADCAPVEASLPPGREAEEKVAFPFGPKDDAGRSVAGPWVAPRLEASIPPGAAAYTGMLADPCFTTSFEILFRLPSDPLGTPNPAESF